MEMMDGWVNFYFTSRLGLMIILFLLCYLLG
jgi:hypothetical protein